MPHVSKPQISAISGDNFGKTQMEQPVACVWGEAGAQVFVWGGSFLSAPNKCKFVCAGHLTEFVSLSNWHIY